MNSLLCGFRSHLIKQIILALIVSTSVVAQSRDRTIEWSSYPISSRHVRPTPGTLVLDQINGIEIEDIMENGKPIALGQPFPAGDDWLNGITFRVRNTSSQRLVAIQIDLVLPEMSPTIGIPFVYGNPTEKEKFILPGEQIEIRVPTGIYGWAKDKITETGHLSRITRAQIREMLVTLPDGTRWVSGCIKTINPKNACPVPSP